LEINLEYITQTKQQLDNIKQKAIKVNNTISDLDQEHITGYDWCGVDNNWLNIELTEYKRVRLYYTDEDSYQFYWEIPFNLFDFTEEELVLWAEDEIKKLNDTGFERKVKTLERDAREVGYKLVKIEGE
jgi:hypothetical protein